MPVKWLVAFILIFPAMLYASQEEDMELFEFLAVYEQDDSAFIDAEIDERVETAQADISDNLTNQNLSNQELKSESHEQ